VKASDKVSSRDVVRSRDWCELSSFGVISIASDVIDRIQTAAHVIGIASRSQLTCIGTAFGRKLTCIRVPSGRPHHCSIFVSPDCMSPWLIDCTHDTVRKQY